MAAGEFIEVLSPTALADLNTLNAELVKTVASVTEVNRLMGTAKTPSGSNSAIKQINEDLKKQDQIIGSLTQKLAAADKERLNEIRLMQQREKAFDRYEAQLNREQQKLAAANNLYNQTQKKLNDLSNEYKHLATMKEMDMKLTDAEKAKYLSLQAEIKKYDTTLKAVDATMGKYTRNVGNYASGFNPLSNSINQLTREAPAFANSIQTGFMALSNNIPIFFDAMKQANAQVRLLQEQGKPTEGVLSRLAGALFSWQTLLSVGVTLLTIYGDEMIEWVQTLWDGEKALTAANKALINFQEAQRKGAVSAQSEIAAFKELINIVSDPAIDPKKRKVALDELNSTYSGYLGNLTLEQALHVKTSAAYKEIIKALEAKNQYQKSTAATDQLREELSLTEQELKFREEEILLRRKANELGRKGATPENYKDWQEAKKALEAFMAKEDERRDKLREDDKTKGIADANYAQLLELKASQTQILTAAEAKNYILKKDSLLLEEKAAKATDAKNEKSIKEIEFEKEKIRLAYDLQIAEQELLRMKSEEDLKSDKTTFDEKIAARKDFTSRSMNILELQYKKESDLADEHFASELKKNITNREKNLKANAENVAAGFGDDREKIEKQFTDNIIAITESAKNAQFLIEVDFSKKWRSLLTEDTKFYRDIEDQKIKINKETSDILFSTEQDSLKREISNNQLKTKARQAYFDEWKNRALGILELNEKIALSQEGLSPEQMAKISAEFAKMRGEIEATKSPMDELKASTKTWMDSFVSGFFGEAGFPTLFKVLNGDVADFGKKFGETFVASMEIAQEAFNFIAQRSSDTTKAQLDELDEQRKMALKFAGEDAAAKAKIEEEYEARKRAIELRAFKSKQRMAIINVIIDTAQAVVASVAATPITFGLPFSAFALAIGAAQVGLIASQKPPTYWTGTDSAKEGLAYTDERGAEIHTDKHGRIKDFGSGKGARLKYLSKGDIIYDATKTKRILQQNDFDTQLGGILSSNGINTPLIINNGITAPEMAEIMDNSLANQPQIINKWDKDGFGSYVSRNGNITRRAEQRGSGKGISI